MSAAGQRVVDPGLDALLAGHPVPRRALFLDRDGVINEDDGYVHSASGTRWIPGIFALCRAAVDAGYLIVVVTNQAGIARGLYTDAQFRDYTRWMHEAFAGRGVPIAATYYCPHHPTAGLHEARIVCECRKPAPGMFLAACAALGIDAAASMHVGDKASDLEAARAAGVATRLLLGDAPLPAGERRIHALTEAMPFLAYEPPMATGVQDG